MGAQMLREVASRTNDEAGDGTTTATVLAQAIVVKEGVKAVAAGMNPMDLKRGIDQAVEAVVADRAKALEKSARLMLKSRRVGTISPQTATAQVGEMIAAAMEKRRQRRGHHGRGRPKSLESELEVVEGMQFDRGYHSARTSSRTQTR